MPEFAWRESDRRRAADRCNNDAVYLREAYLAVAAPTISESRDEILRRARAGELTSLGAIDDVRTLPDDVVNALINRLCSEIDTLIEKAAKGVHTTGFDHGKALTLLNVWHVSSARWDRIETLFKARLALPNEYSGALRILAVLGATLPPGTKERLVEHIEALRHREPTRSFFDIETDIRGLLAEAQAALIDESARREVVRELLCGDTASRASCARIIERFGSDAEAGLLLALAGDANLTVRDAALSGLGKLIATGWVSDTVKATLLKVLESGGTSSATAIVSRLDGHSDAVAVFELLNAAAKHPSARIRFEAARISRS